MNRIYIFVTIIIALTNSTQAMDSKQFSQEGSPTFRRSSSSEDFAALLKIIHEQRDRELVQSPALESPVPQATSAQDQSYQPSTIKKSTRVFNLDDSQREDMTNTLQDWYDEGTVDFANFKGEPTVDLAVFNVQSAHNQHDLEESDYGDLDRSNFQDATINEPQNQDHQAESPDDVIFTLSASDTEPLSLHQAVNAGNRDLVVQLLAVDKDKLNGTNDQGETPLHLAAYHNFTTILADLLAAGAEIDAKTVLGKTALHYAALRGNTAILHLLLAQKAAIDVQATNGWTALHYTAWHGHLETTAMLIINGANTTLVCTAKNSPLHFAAWKNHIKVASVLINNNASLTACNSSGATPLHYAAYKGNVALIELIYSEDKDLQRVTLTGNTPLHCAAWRGHLSVVKFLHANGVSVNRRNTHTLTPVECAMDAFKKKLRHLLVGENNTLKKKNSVPLTAEKQIEYQEVIAFLSSL